MSKDTAREALYKALTFYISAYINLILVKGFLKLISFLLRYLFQTPL
jgi:hypothetical protein